MSHADTIYTNARIYTVDDTQPWAEALAIKDGKFIKVGSTGEVAGLAGENTRIIDLDGGFVMPGIHDDHLHPDVAAESIMNVQLDSEMSWSEVQASIKKFIADNPEAAWVYGGNLNWLRDNNETIEILNKPSSKYTLDEISTDKPIFLWDVGMHAALLNSRAMEMTGFTRDTPNPEGGVIVKGDDGEPTGVLRELAANIVWGDILQTLPVGNSFAYEGLKPVIDHLNSLGMTAISDVWARHKSVDAYCILSDAQELNARIFVYVAEPSEWPDEAMKEEARKLIADADNYNRPRINVGGIKFVLDGSAGGQTAVMVDPYDCGCFHGHWRNPPEYFLDAIEKYDQQGFTIKTHAVGDLAVRTTLDGIEKMRNNGSKLRHNVAHTVIVNPDDMQRFKALDAGAEFSPYFWYPGEHKDLLAADIGDIRINWSFPIKSVLETGARVSIGSDWPVVNSPNPWPAIESLVTRQVAGGGPEAFTPEEAISLEQALECYTLGGAYAMYLEQKSGSITAGKYADFIVLNHNLFDIPITEVHKTKVQQTILEGEVIYQA